MVLMRAMATPGYGPLERLAAIDVPMPTPGRGEVRVRVAVSALNPADYKVLLGTLKVVHARTRPLIVGYDFSGTVDAVGADVTSVSVGDEVFGCLPYSMWNRRGAFAEALIARADEIARKPQSVSHELAAAAVTTGLTAIQSIRDLGRLPERDGQVLVTGASGGVGSISVGIATRLGASVTAVGSGKGLELARRLGAAAVWDRTRHSLPGDVNDKFDVVFDAASAYRWRDWRRNLKPGGTYVTTFPSVAFAIDKVASWFSRTRVRFIQVKSRPADLELLGKWLQEGLEVPLVGSVAVRDVARGLLQLQQSGGRISVRVADGF
jgi:NADPH:quinone reductase-like Zn-dependent oxidoreductase